MIVVADAGPLIALGRIGRLELLLALYGEVVVPGAVWNEIVVAGGERAGAAAVRDARWIEQVAVDEADELFASLRTTLDAGESAAICLASRQNADLILLDERKGRAIAKRLGLRVKGTLGVLVSARRLGALEAVAPAIRALELSGIYIAPTLARAILEAVDETVAAVGEAEGPALGERDRES